jgi:hypothetical protein
MDKLLEILRQHKNTISYMLTFGVPEILTIKFKDGSTLSLCEHNKCKTGKKKQIEYIRQKYESAKKIAEEVWLDGDYEGTHNDFYYFQCGFAAGMNYESKYKDSNSLGGMEHS